MNCDYLPPLYLSHPNPVFSQLLLKNEENTIRQLQQQKQQRGQAAAAGVGGERGDPEEGLRHHTERMQSLMQLHTLQTALLSLLRVGVTECRAYVGQIAMDE